MRSERFLADRSDEPISAEQAASLIFSTAQPTLTQVGGVRDLMRRGELRQSAKRHFTTTREAIAEYMANRELRKAERSVQRGSETASQSGEDTSGKTLPRRGKTPGTSRVNRRTQPARRAADDRHLRGVYRELLHDYFLSVVVYGRAHDRSAQCQRRVLYGRCVLVVLLAAFIGWTFYRMGLAASVAPAWAEAGKLRVQQDHSPEKQVVLEFLRKYRKAAVLMDVLPANPRPGGKAIRVRYRHDLTDRRTGEVRTPIEDTVFIIRDGEILHDEKPIDQDRAVEAKLTGAPALQDPLKRPSVDGLLPPPPKR